MRFFCTYFDKNYLSRGLLMQESLKAVSPDSHLFVLALDHGTLSFLKNQADPRLSVIPLADIEITFPQLLSAKKNRNWLEYYFTLSPFLPRYVFLTHPNIEMLTYLDADLFFYSSFEPIFQEMADSPIGIIPHRFSAALKKNEENGIFNVAWITFRSTGEGLQCLIWWAEKCLEWCYDRLESGKFADQKYLDCWPVKFPHTHIIAHPGANLAPWNLSGAKLFEHQGEITVDGWPLIFYHFHGLRRWWKRIFATHLRFFGVSWEKIRFSRKHLYKKYLHFLNKKDKNLEQAGFFPTKPSRYFSVTSLSLSNLFAVVKNLVLGLLFHEFIRSDSP